MASIHIRQQYLTADEPDYYTYAARWAHGQVERTDKMYDSKTPIVAPALIPRIVKQLLQPGYRASDSGHQDMVQGRYFMAVYTIVIALYLFVWIRKLFGDRAWILPVLFFLFDPMVIGFSMIITSDMASGACLLATIYHLHAFYLNGRRKDFILFSFWVGLSFVCKASLLFLLPCFVLMALWMFVRNRWAFQWRKAILYGAGMSLIALLVLNLSYFGKESFTPLHQFTFKSAGFQQLSDMPVLQYLPVPVPANYVVSLDMLQYHSDIGAGTAESTYPGVFLNGETRHQSGFWNYYLLVGVLKIPLATVLFIVTGILLVLWNAGKMLRWGPYGWFLFPAFFFLIVLSFFNHFQLGLRHALLFYPFVFMGMAALNRYLRVRLALWPAIAWGLFGWLVISASLYFPHLMAYTNELVTDKKNVYKIIKDASIDYGQNREDVQAFLKDHPEYSYPTTSPLPGKYIVRMMDLFDEGPGSLNVTYPWLHPFEPESHYRYSMLLFDISEQDITDMKKRLANGQP